MAGEWQRERERERKSKTEGEGASKMSLIKANSEGEEKRNESGKIQVHEDLNKSESFSEALITRAEQKTYRRL